MSTEEPATKGRPRTKTGRHLGGARPPGKSNAQETATALLKDTNRAAFVSLLKEIDRAVATQSGYKISWYQFIDWPVTRVLQVVDAAAILDLVPFALETGAGIVGIVTAVIGSFVNLLNTLNTSEHYYELIGATEGTVAWTFDDPKPEYGTRGLTGMKQHYSGQRLANEMARLKTAFDEAVEESWNGLNTLSEKWILQRWPQAAARASRSGGVGAHLRVSRGPAFAAPLPVARAQKKPPENPRAVFKFLLQIILKADREAYEKRLLKIAQEDMSGQDQAQFAVISGLKYM